MIEKENEQTLKEVMAGYMAGIGKITPVQKALKEAEILIAQIGAYQACNYLEEAARGGDELWKLYQQHTIGKAGYFYQNPDVIFGIAVAFRDLGKVTEAIKVLTDLKRM